jgi:DNA-binding winged helix-turn-helix (wHTH) protein
MKAPARVVFGTCELDVGQRILLRHGAVVPLSLKAFQLLTILIDRRPEALSKTELLDRLWLDTAVSDASLHNLVTEIRAAIGDTPRASRFIRTVPRFGYAFHGQAHAVVGTPARSGRARAGPSLVSKDAEWSLAEGTNVVGRDRDCEVVIDSPGVSRRHARIMVASRNATVEDLGSKNGTYVDGARIDQPVALEEGTQVRVGSISMTFRHLEDAGSTKTLRQV